MFLDGRGFATCLCVISMGLHHDYTQHLIPFPSKSIPACLFQGRTPELVSNLSLSYVHIFKNPGSLSDSKKAAGLYEYPPWLDQFGVTFFGAG